MFYAYILKSDNSERYYKGFCADIEIRLKRHNAGQVRSTKAFRPWRLHYVETFENKADAIKREHFFKSPDGWAFLKNIGII